MFWRFIQAYLVPDVNAFAMANGCMRVFAGLMDQLSDDEVRGVIGHEIGHVKLGHSLTKMRTALLAAGTREGMAASGKGRASEIAASQIGGLAESVVNSQFSQKEELAADEYGYHFMVRHHYDPNAMVSMFKKLGGSGGLVSSHPASPRRVKNIETLIVKGAKKK
ncbi:M48 family metalloprotease [Xanthomonadaceae bacterium JHOS43]|nr:M48 family metalloprotease [Xanthomonadaceae bacterium JHOS43]